MLHKKSDPQRVAFLWLLLTCRFYLELTIELITVEQYLSLAPTNHITSLNKFHACRIGQATFLIR